MNSVYFSHLRYSLFALTCCIMLTVGVCPVSAQLAVPQGQMQYGRSIESDSTPPVALYQPVSRVDRVSYNHAELNSHQGKELILHDDPFGMYCAPRVLREAEIQALLHVGKEYELGTSANFQVTVDVTIRGFTAAPANTNLITLTTTLTIRSDNLTQRWEPEQLYRVLIPIPTYQSLDRFEISIGPYLSAGPPPVQDSVRLDISCIERYDINLEPVSHPEMMPFIQTIAVSTSSLEGRYTITTASVTFEWKTKAPCANDIFPNYEFQLLRLYNIDRNNADDEYRVKAVVDWSQAMSIETGSSRQSITLTIPEGTGYYVWRVRPIGDALPGGIANSRNWGVWSIAPPNGCQIEIEGANAQNYSGNALICNPQLSQQMIPDYQAGYARCFFLYKQFDDDLNWIYSRTFTEGTRISESMTYANALLQTRQDQKHCQSDGTVLVAQTVQDFSGRRALTTLPVPVETQEFGYKEKFLKTSTNEYTASQFDQSSNYMTPPPVLQDINWQYYSNVNQDKTIPSSDNFPFTRTLYHPDNTGRVKEQSGVGLVHKTGGRHTTRTVYAPASETELIAMFGDEAPSTSNVYKVITTNPNTVATVTYIDNNDKILATCLVTSNQATSLQELPNIFDSHTMRNYYPNGIQVNEVIAGSVHTNEYTIESQKTIVLSEATLVQVHYRITTGTIQLSCQPCTNCDYKVVVRVSSTGNLSVPIYSTNVVVPALAICTSLTISISTSMTLPAGAYIVEKIITTNNITTSTLAGIASPVKESYLEKYVRVSMGHAESEVTSALVHVYNYLGAVPPDIDGLYLYLSTQANVQNSPKASTIATSCYAITIPHIECPQPFACSTTNIPDFEEYLYDKWADKLGLVGTERYNPDNYFFTDGQPTYLNNPTGPFNTLIFNMLNEELPGDKYDCNKLWQCWEALVAQYFVRSRILVDDHYEINPDFDLLQEFLDCTGRRLCGYSEEPYGSNGYLEYSHKYFKYDYTLGEMPDCERLAVTAESGIDIDNVYFENNAHCGDPDWQERWKRFYECTRYELTDEMKDVLAESGNGLPSECNDLADSDPEGYKACVDKLLKQSENNCKTECEEKRPAFIAAILTAYREEGKTVGDESSYGTYDISWEQVRCQADKLVNDCKDNCKLTVTLDAGSGWITQIGTVQEIANMQKSLVYPFTITFPDETGTCSSTTAVLVNTTANISAILVSYLNTELETFRRTVGSDGGEWHVTTAIRRSFNIPLADILMSPIKVYPFISSRFILSTTCQLIYQEDQSIIGTSQDPHPMVDHLNTMLDNLWGFPIALSVPHEEEYYSDLMYHYYVYRSYDNIPPGFTAAVSDGEHGTGRAFPFINGVNQLTPVSQYLQVGVPASPYVTAWRLISSPDHFKLSGLSLSFLPFCSITAPTIAISLYPTGISSTGTITTFESLQVLPNEQHSQYPFVAIHEEHEIARYFEPFSSEAMGRFGQDEEGYLTYQSFLSTSGTIVYNSPVRIPCIHFQNSSTAIVVMTNACAVIMCPDICIEYLEPKMPTTNVITMRPLSCEDYAAAEIRRAISTQIDNILVATEAEARASYRSVCSENINDRLQVIYNLKYYHHTLYYYDRAGRLVRTVPPRGADINANRTRATHPNHKYVTSYKYNSLGQLVWQQTPDGGTMVFLYDKKGQIRFSQNEKQGSVNLPSNSGWYSYTKYDELGRVIETGELQNNTTGFIPMLADNPQFPYPNDPTTPLRFLTRTIYTTAAAGANFMPGNLPQRYLQNRISYAYTDVDGSDASLGDRVTTHYSYDPHGNVEWLLQDIPTLNRKYIRYDYDLISGKVLELRYNNTWNDEFNHRYDYDADNRLTTVETSRDGRIWDVDGRYEYYKHGPLRRLVLGDDHIQGLDYVYTIHGWLKGINHPSIAWDRTTDPGRDAVANEPNGRTARDAFGMILGYYEGDFNRLNSPFSSMPANQWHLPGTPLYDGNISSWTHNVDYQAAGNTVENLAGETFVYDRLSRLVQSRFRTYDGNAQTKWPTSQAFETDYAYDPNGNFRTLSRRSRSLPMDNMGYTYQTGTNRLTRVNDVVSIMPPGTDIQPGQNPNNYEYDQIGNLVSDDQEQLTVEWNPQGKVTRVVKTGAETIEFLYDAMGNRVWKKISTGGFSTTWYYVYDVTGNVLAIYRWGTEALMLEELLIYGSDRLGSMKPKLAWSNTPLDENRVGYTRLIRKKEYELKDHLGNVRVVVSDVKESTTPTPGTAPFRADIKAFNNYYAFGMLQAERSWSSGAYRYGYNGMEHDDEIKGVADSYTTHYRMYDPRLGRWWSVDPKMKVWESPYTSMSNNPILMIDPRGDTNDYFDNKGAFLGRDVAKTSGIRIISRDNFHRITGARSNRSTPETITEDLISLSDPISVMQENKSTGKLESNIDDAGIKNMLNYYYSLAGYNPGELKNGQVGIKTISGIASTDLTSVEPLIIDVERIEIGRTFLSRYDIINTFVHERGGHGNQIQQDLIPPAFSKAHSLYWPIEGGATQLQVQHWTWVHTSMKFKTHLYENKYGQTFSAQDQKKYWGKYGIKLTGEKNWPGTIKIVPKH